MPYISRKMLNLKKKKIRIKNKKKTIKNGFKDRNANLKWDSNNN